MSKDVKKKILDAIAYVRANGFTLVCEDWGEPKFKAACAISCVVLKDDLNANVANNMQAASTILGVTEKWLDAFIEGFDNNGTADQSQVPEAWKIGNEVSKETKPIAYHLWDGEYDG
jgi:hypothetical protein